MEVKDVDIKDMLRIRLVLRESLKDRKVKQRRGIKIWLNLLIRPEEK
jgi:hypothetical protein